VEIVLAELLILRLSLLDPSPLSPHDVLEHGRSPDATGVPPAMAAVLFRSVLPALA